MADEVLIKGGGFSLLSFIFRHWYVFVVIFITLPMLISTINQAVKTQNPSLPFVNLGLRIINSDGALYRDVEDLKSNPTAFIGMEKPEHGIFRTFLYYWNFFFEVIWKIFGSIFLISLPFVALYKFTNMSDTTSPAKNLIKTIIYAIIFIFFMNLIMLIHGLIQGTLALTSPDSGIFLEIWWIIKLTLPFRGITNLIIYIINLFI